MTNKLKTKDQEADHAEAIKDTLLLILCYTIFWGFLLGFCAILLKGEIDTDETHTLLWSFLVLGLFFMGLVGTAVKIGTDAQEREKVSKRRTALVEKRKASLDAELALC